MHPESGCSDDAAAIKEANELLAVLITNSIAAIRLNYRVSYMVDN